jgi:hypothetical protein
VLTPFFDKNCARIPTGYATFPVRLNAGRAGQPINQFGPDPLSALADAGLVTKTVVDVPRRYL